VATEILISNSPGETRVAVVRDGVLLEYDNERHDQRSVVGNIYRGRVTRVLPGMQAAFVDIGLDRAAFLYVDEVTVPGEEGELDAEPDAEAGLVDLDPGATEAESGPETEGAEQDLDSDPSAAGAPSEPGPPVPSRTRPPRPPIEELLQAGQDVLVQVRKAPFATKGARVTTYLTLPGRFVVYMPTLRRLGVSRKITQETERRRLKEILFTHRNAQEGGFIARTSCEGQARQALARDMEFVRTLWSEVEERGRSGPVPGLVLADLDLLLRTCRDAFSEQVDRLVADDPDDVERLRKRVLRHSPDLANRIHLHQGTIPLFEASGIQGQIDRIFERTVRLPSGGSLVIDEAEALTAIDVNTGRYVGRKNLEQTILATNLEAAAAAAAQIRLRDLGGIIVVDFIDMQLPESRARVYDAFVRAMAEDRAKAQLGPINEFGLVELTRRRTRGSVHRRHTEPCPYCGGRGRIRSKTSICLEILRSLVQQAERHPRGQLWVSAMPEVAQSLSQHPQLLALEERLGRTVTLEARSELHQEVFHVTVR